MPDANSHFGINQRLGLVPFDELEYLPSRIEDFRGNDLVVAMPMRKGVPVFLPIGTAISGKSMTTEGVFYAFDSSLLEYSLKPIPIWVLKQPENIKKIQMRDFFRYKITFPVTLFLIDGEGFPVEETKIVGKSRNLSGGGISVLSEKTSFPEGAKLWLEISFPRGEKIKTTAVVIRIDTMKITEKKSVYVIALQFVDIAESFRRRIIQLLNYRTLEERNG